MRLHQISLINIIISFIDTQIISDVTFVFVDIYLKLYSNEGTRSFYNTTMPYI